MKLLPRVLFLSMGALWAVSFVLASWANVSMFGSLLPPGPIDAHDLDDLIVWFALMAWIYATPLLLLLIWWIRRGRAVRQESQT